MSDYLNFSSPQRNRNTASDVTGSTGTNLSRPSNSSSDGDVMASPHVNENATDRELDLEMAAILQNQPSSSSPAPGPPQKPLKHSASSQSNSSVHLVNSSAGTFISSGGVAAALGTGGGHGMLPDDDDPNSFINFKPPSSDDPGSFYDGKRRVLGGTGHGQLSYEDNTNNNKPPPSRHSADGGDMKSFKSFHDDSTTGGSSIAGGGMQKKAPSFFQQTGTHLRGQEPPIPRYFLAYGYRNNSFFAKRLMFGSIVVSFVMFIGVMFYWFYKKDQTIENGGFYIKSPSDVYLFQTDNGCYSMVAFSSVVYHAAPLVFLIGLPASGIRFFEPFKREKSIDEQGNRIKVKRTLVFQACEVICVVTLFVTVFVFIYFLYFFFNGGAFQCGEKHVLVFAIVAVICYFLIFAVLTMFARFREHVKMQLGAFTEGDQTGNVRQRMVDSQTNKFLSKRHQVVADIRKRLYKATQLQDLFEMRRVIDSAKDLLGEDFATEMYPDCKIYLGIFGTSHKNPLHVAAYHGNIAAMDLLVSCNIRVNSLDKFMRVRFTTGDLFWYFAQFFIPRAATPQEENAVSIFKTTLVMPIHCAVSTGRVEAVRWLIAHGAEVNTKAKSTYRSERIPPIFMAENPEIVQMLLDKGADQLIIPDPGHMNTVTVLQLAYMSGNYAVAQVLEEAGGDVALTPLHFAAAANNYRKVLKYLRYRAHPNTLGEQGYIGLNRRTPLHWAAVNGSTEAAEVLLNAKADPNFQDNRGRTPLHWAARLNNAKTVKCLLEAGADPNIVDIDMMTPLICAAFAKSIDEAMIKDLVDHGADINYQIPSSGDTALHIAVRCENQQTALSILACGGNIMRTNAEGYRPIDCTTSTKLQFEIKRAAGNRDVMISYTHSHSEFAKKLRKSLEEANVTTWLDLMDPSGIGGGSVWREEIARGITNAALVVCILTEDYAQSEWCLKELALAKQVGTPVLAISAENVRIGEELQVYLYTRQIIPFEPAITAVNNENPKQVTYSYNEIQYAKQFRLLLDGVRDEVEKKRAAVIKRNTRRRTTNNLTMASDNSFYANTSDVFNRTAPWDLDGQTQFLFVSHGDSHTHFVGKLYQELTEKGIMVYLDRSGSSSDMSSRIHEAKEAILKCTCFVVILSSRTCRSELVRDQLAFAEDKGKPIYPVVLNDIDVGDDKRYTLSRIDLFHFAMDGLGFRGSFEALENGLKKHMRIGLPSHSSFVNLADRRRVGNTQLTDAGSDMVSSFMSYSGDMPENTSTRDPGNTVSLSTLEDGNGSLRLTFSGTTTTHVQM